MSSAKFKFEDNSARFLEDFNDCSIAFLEEVKDSLVSQVQRNTPVKTGDLKRSFGEDSYVDESELVAYIGSSKEYSVWVERGKKPVPRNRVKSVNKYATYCINIKYFY